MSFRKRCGHFLPYFFSFCSNSEWFRGKKTPEKAAAGAGVKMGGPLGRLRFHPRQDPKYIFQASFLFVCLNLELLQDTGCFRRPVL
jgi:hypothetical protein